MKVKDLIKELEKVDGDVEIMVNVYMEQGRGGCGGVDWCPSISKYEKGQYKMKSGDDTKEELMEDPEWEWDDDDGMFINNESIVVIGVDIEEEWSD